MASNISWKEFEAIVSRLQKTFHKTGAVSKDERIVGKRSGIPRQIDICVRTCLGGENVLLIVECKRWNRRVDVKAVEAFAGVRKDVGAHVAIMVSTAGFTKAALEVAASENISLYKYRDTSNENWPNGVPTQVLLEVWELIPTAAYYVLHDGTKEQILTDDGIEVIEVNDGSKGRLATLVRKVWESFEATDQREWNWLAEIACTSTDRPEIRKIGIGAQSRLVRGTRRGRLHFEGFVDQRDGHAKVDGWKMEFDGPLIPLSAESRPPMPETYMLQLSSVFVKTRDPKSELVQSLVYRGQIKLDVRLKEVTPVPVEKGIRAAIPERTERISRKPRR